MTEKRLPPFSALRAFEAAARHVSFKAAANELCITPSAISHQVRILEQFLGRPVFLRAGNRLTLTRAGKRYAASLSEILGELFDATESAAVMSLTEPLRIQATAAFNARWLVPRLGRCPMRDAISIRNAAGAPETDFAVNECDMIIHWGDAPIPGCHVHPLLKTGRYPVASPELAGEICSPRDLLRQMLLRDQVMDGWAQWFRLAGMGMPDEALGGTFNANCEVNMTAAERGQGIALAWDAIVRPALSEGRLVRLFEIETAPVTIYSIAYPAARASDARVAAMRDWLLAEAGGQGGLVAPPPMAAAQ